MPVRPRPGRKSFGVGKFQPVLRVTSVESVLARLKERLVEAAKRANEWISQNEAQLAAWAVVQDELARLRVVAAAAQRYAAKRARLRDAPAESSKALLRDLRVEAQPDGGRTSCAVARTGRRR